jgi:hypothetical protein
MINEISPTYTFAVEKVLHHLSLRNIFVKNNPETAESGNFVKTAVNPENTLC